MKNIFHLLIISLLSIFVSGCDNNLNYIEDSLIGKWKLTEGFISAGGPQYWVDIEDGEEFVFSENGTFTSSRFSECAGGNFFVESGVLILKYNCDGFEDRSENSEGFITYNLKIESKYFVATPTSGPICIEGCSYKYQKE